MTKPVCVPCQRFYRPHKNGIYILEGMPINGFLTPPGTSHPEEWAPYKVWCADQWKCEGCGHEIVAGFAHEPLAIHHEGEKFEAAKALTTLRVNDC